MGDGSNALFDLSPLSGDRPRELKNRRNLLLLGAALLDVVASVLAFVAFERASRIYAVLAVLVTLALVASARRGHRASLIAFIAWSAVGAFAQFPLKPFVAGFSILICAALAAVLAVVWGWPLREFGSRRFEQ